MKSIRKILGNRLIVRPVTIGETSEIVLPESARVHERTYTAEVVRIGSGREINPLIQPGVIVLVFRQGGQVTPEGMMISSLDVHAVIENDRQPPV